MPENTPIGSIVKKYSLKKHFFTEQFSLLLTGHSNEEFDNSKVYIKRLEALPALSTGLIPSVPSFSPFDDCEEGEISSVAAGSSEGDP